jgi:hypothetical protein
VGVYDEMADMANELLLPDTQGGFGQGTVQIKRIELGGLIDPNNQWGGRHEHEKVWTIRAAVRRLHQRYEGGILIIETGDHIVAGTMATLTMVDGVAVPPVEQAFEPMNGDLIVIDGADRAIDNITPIPGAGVTSAWKLWSKA